MNVQVPACKRLICKRFEVDVVPDQSGELALRLLGGIVVLHNGFYIEKNTCDLMIGTVESRGLFGVFPFSVGFPEKFHSVRS